MRWLAQVFNVTWFGLQTIPQRLGSSAAAVFGINDGLVSNLALVMGFAGAATDNEVIVLAGIAGLLAGAFSMAAGEYISMQSQKELFERQIELEREELRFMPEREREELAALYRSKGLSEEEAEGLVARGRTIVAMAYSIHSTEVGGTLAALRLLHHLAASDAPEVLQALDETVLLVLPSHNPDGTQLVTEWYRRHLGTEFEGTPPPVLYHPYVGHDNNRDGYGLNMIESRASAPLRSRRLNMHRV